MALTVALVDQAYRALDAGRYLVAECLAHRAWLDRKRDLGNEHLDTLATRYVKAHALDGLGLYDKALEEIEASLPTQETVSGKEHPGTLFTRHLKVKVLGRLGRYDEALELIDALLTIEERVRGKEHPKTLKTHEFKAEAVRLVENLSS